jgi:hypothetical protein
MNAEFLLMLHETFPPGHIIDLFNSLRREKLFLKIQGVREGAGDKDLTLLQVQLEFHLCHPLLLTTAIAGSIVGLPSHLDQLNVFLAGGVLSDFQSLAEVSMASFADMNQLSAFTRYEEIYYVGLYSFLLDSFRKGGKNACAHCLHRAAVERLITEGYTNDGIRNFHQTFGFSPHDVRWNAWQIFNMPMGHLAGLGSERHSTVLFTCGILNNKRWHSITDRADSDLNQLKLSFNASAKSRDLEAIKVSAERLRIGEYLCRRAERFYWWNPCEIDAHRVGDKISERISEGLSKGIADADRGKHSWVGRMKSLFK